MEAESNRPQTAVTWAFKVAKKYKTAVRFVLVALAEFIDTGNACPSHKELAAETGLARSTVQGALGELEKDGTIKRTKNGGTQVRGGKTNCYRLVGWPGESTPVESVPSDSHPPESIPGESVPPESILSTSSTTEYVPAYTHTGGDAATRVNDLSLSAKDKNKNKPPITPQGDAPDGASVAVSKPKRERTKPVESVPDEVYQRLMRGVLINSFGVDPANPDLKGILTDKDYKRAGILVKWLRSVPVSPESLREFYARYRLEHDGAAAPRDLDKFKLHYAAFVQSQTRPISHSMSPSIPAYIEVQDRPRLAAHEVVDLSQLQPGVRR